MERKGSGTSLGVNLINDESESYEKKAAAPFNV